MQQETCAECGTPLESQDDKRRGGREQRYCSDRCRQAAYRREKAAQRKEEKRQSGAQTHWFDKKIALEVLRYRFQLGKEIIRIATGFFTVRGYNLLRAAAHDKRMYILVGLDDPGEKRVRKALIQEIMLDLRTGVDIDRRSAVLELVEKLKGGNFQIVDARAMQHHAKLYIVDMAVAMIGSANMTGRGLMEAIEAGNVIEDPAKVADLVQKYNEYFYHPGCINISQELIEALLKWLQMARPWEVYLKTLDAMKSLAETSLQRTSYQQPVGYQNVVIARALRQIEETRGAMVVASTGLGKTVIGTDIALRLHEHGEILNVMVIGPKAVKKEWRKRLASAGLPCDYFIHQVLDASPEQHWEAVDELEERLASIDDQWLIIIDESHELRNRYRKDISDRQMEERRAFQRLVPVIQRSQCKVLLLTGTPYSTDVENINNQLYLLPHTASLQVLPTLEGYFDPKPWRIDKLQKLKDSPVGSVITTPHVAKYYGSVEGDSISIDFHGERRYIPHVQLYRVDVVPILEREIVQALDNGYFAVDAPPWTWKVRTSIERTLRVAWGSSPWALHEVIANVLGVGRETYNVSYVRSPEEQQKALEPILDQLRNLTVAEDAKLRWLCTELDQLCGNGGKVIVFSEQLATVVYLEQALATLVPSLKVACTVKQSDRQSQKKTKTGRPQHKSDRDISRLLADFDPSTTPLIEDQKYNVLLTTDAFGVGVNLQTAQTVINYDLAWTPIEPTQRAGRVLRLFPSPRTVKLYTLIPKQSGDVQYRRISQGLFRRSAKLIQRHEDSTSILDLPTIATEIQQVIHMANLAAGISVFNLGEIQIDQVEKLEVSKSFNHAAVLEPFKKVAQAIPDDIISAMEYDGNKPLMYVLLWHNGKHYWPLYDINRQRLMPTHKDISVILDHIACQEGTPTAIIDADLVERWSDACIQAWCHLQKVAPDQVIRICAMYLQPKREMGTFRRWLDPEEEEKPLTTSHTSKSRRA